MTEPKTTLRAEPQGEAYEFDWNQPSANMTTEEIEQAAAHVWPPAELAAVLTTALAECLELDRHELAAAIAVVQCRAMQARTHEALAGMVER